MEFISENWAFIVSAIAAVDKFSDLVDDALGDMNKLLETNTAVSAFVNGSVEENT